MATTQSNISVDFSEAPVKAGASFAVDGDMGPCLVIAEEMGGYVLSDELTFSLFAADHGIIG